MTLTRIESVAADSNVLLSAIAGRAARRVFERAPHIAVVTTEATVAEVEEYLPEFADRYGIDPDVLRDVLILLPVTRYSESDYVDHIGEARKRIGNRDPDDVHLAALALKLGVPIWSNDKDFEEMRIDVYTTAQLLKVLGI